MIDHDLFAEALDRTGTDDPAIPYRDRVLAVDRARGNACVVDAVVRAREARDRVLARRRECAALPNLSGNRRRREPEGVRCGASRELRGRSQRCPARCQGSDGRSGIRRPRRAGIS